MSKFAVFVGARNVYLHADSTKSKYGAHMFWVGGDEAKKIENIKLHPSIKSARSWVPSDRKDEEWETVIHELDFECNVINTFSA